MGTGKMARKQRKNRKKLEKGSQNIESMLKGSSKNEPAMDEKRNNINSQIDSDSLNVLGKKQSQKGSKKKQKNYVPEVVIQQKLPAAYSKQTTEESKHKSRKHNANIDEVIRAAPSSFRDAESTPRDHFLSNENDLPEMIKPKNPVDVPYSPKSAEHLRDNVLDKEDHPIGITPTKNSNGLTTVSRSNGVEKPGSDSDHSDFELISPLKNKKSPRKLLLSDSESENSDSSYPSTSLPKAESDLVSRKPKRKLRPCSSEDESVECFEGSLERPPINKYSNKNITDDFDTEIKQEAEDLEPVSSEDEKHKRNRNPTKKAFHEKLELIRKKRRQGSSSINAEEDMSESAGEKTDTSDDDSLNEESFIVNEEEEEEALGARALLPPEFSMTSHQGLRAHFANFLRYHIKQLTNLPIEKNIDEHFLFSCKTIRRRLFSSVESNVISSIWKPNFISVLKNRPLMTNRRCEATYGCDACNMHSRLSTQVVRFKGHIYDRDTYKTLENDQEYHEESNKDWLLGSSCHERARLAHKSFHWEYDVRKEIMTQLSLAGYFEVQATSLDQMYQAIEENNYPESSWQEYCKLLKFASSSLLSGWRSGYQKHG
ncbi:DUF4196 and DUF4211, CCDC82-like protein [Schizosaccharomyces osmophilus]|uniref:DUF4196 and DUF4211, CCDC82-like protein n=1 Tax=Schizosaccharomyces osmophilus TaxID=2545709 RepID=A0AAF0AXD6_9SCHI|nr:DUF4196 and DUF4211, CCDC82-like protein [Schizosaccharomyces osmophilus]WBW74015.1 DUF4196 and DUF4211, CCDC82-like protein [Schizosaccharomyces osmophilus]